MPYLPQVVEEYRRLLPWFEDFHQRRQVRVGPVVMHVRACACACWASKQDAMTHAV